jgi:hypothetical protein
MGLYVRKGTKLKNDVKRHSEAGPHFKQFNNPQFLPGGGNTPNEEQR